MVCGSATAGCQIDTLPTPWLVWQFPTLAATPVTGPCRRLPRQTRRWCLESTPILGLDLPEFRLDDPIDARGFLVQTTQLAETLHPRFILDLREKRVPGGRVARAENVVPVLAATGISLVLFFVLKDRSEEHTSELQSLRHLV